MVAWIVCQQLLSILGITAPVSIWSSILNAIISVVAVLIARRYEWFLAATCAVIAIWFIIAIIHLEIISAIVGLVLDAALVIMAVTSKEDEWKLVLFCFRKLKIVYNCGIIKYMKPLKYPTKSLGRAIMKKILWIITWFAAQRIMMGLGLIAHNTLFETTMVTLIGFFFGFIAYDSWLLPFYIAIAIAWGIATIVDGAIIAGILIIAFHLVLLAICNSDKCKKAEPVQRRQRRRRNHRRWRQMRRAGGTSNLRVAFYRI